jgi:hypothetical protein
MTDLLEGSNRKLTHGDNFRECSKVKFTQPTVIYLLEDSYRTLTHGETSVCAGKLTQPTVIRPIEGFITSLSMETALIIWTTVKST